ncbi:hypothetical protein [Piscibacillus halophilus]|uniref:DUF3953 domain-containing protein n=1 Tax=Piscibacillus halophilus TaxID=571933 RepID=A0A1H9GEZ5_9BACI|nr:hypothetical protein [Piscibacillus halophilus]SEQ48661.1 hypothetical protein SAMN05216362_11522 [Piscibacillus halophilus]
MKLLKIINLIFGIIAVVGGFYYLFINNSNLPTYVTFSFMMMLFFMVGFEYVKDRHYKSGYLYFIAAIIMFLIVMEDLMDLL